MNTTVKNSKTETKKWYLVINPYQKQIDFINNETLYIKNFQEKNNNHFYFGCIVPAITWENNSIVGPFGEIVVVNIENNTVKFTGLMAVVNKYFNGYVKIAHGENHLIWWDIDKIKELKKTLNKINLIKQQKNLFN